MIHIIVGVLAIILLSGVWKIVLAAPFVIVRKDADIYKDGKFYTKKELEIKQETKKYQEKLLESEKSRTETKASQAFINGGVHVWVPIMQKKLSVAYSKWKTFWQNQSAD